MTPESRNSVLHPSNAKLCELVLGLLEDPTAWQEAHLSTHEEWREAKHEGKPVLVFVEEWMTHETPLMSTSPRSTPTGDTREQCEFDLTCGPHTGRFSGMVSLVAVSGGSGSLYDTDRR